VAAASACLWDHFCRRLRDAGKAKRQTSLIVGALVLIPGLVLRGLASGHVQKDKQLTTSGPTHTRAILFISDPSCWPAGFAIAARSPWIVAIMLLMFAAIYVPVIAGEERYLRQTFPDYDDYARRVPRFFPRLTLTAASGAPTPPRGYWKHREYSGQPWLRRRPRRPRRQADAGPLMW